MNRNPIRFFLSVLSLCFGVLYFMNAELIARAEPVYTNSVTGYDVHIDDRAGLLTVSEEQRLLKDMEPISYHCDVMFVTVEYNPYSSTEVYARNTLEDELDNKKSVLFMIDMQQREIYIRTGSSTKRLLTNSDCYVITDNTYRYATQENYYHCARRTFEQINDLLEGRRVAAPMKYIVNLFLALALALTVNYIIVKFTIRRKFAESEDIIYGVKTRFETRGVDIINTETHTYAHESSGDSGYSGGGGGGGGGFGGGGGGGGGGGHSF